MMAWAVMQRYSLALPLVFSSEHFTRTCGVRVRTCREISAGMATARFFNNE